MRADEPPLRVLIIGLFPEDPERPVGGVEAATYSVSTALAAHPAIERVVVASVRKGRTRGPTSFGERLTVHHIGAPFVSGDALIRSEQAMGPIRRLARAFRPHVVHGQGLAREGEMACRLGLPAVVTVHGLTHLEARLAARSWRDRFRASQLEGVVRRVLARARLIISISAYDTLALDDFGGAERVSVPNAVPSAFFAGAAGATPDRILFAGVARPRKNLLGLVQAFAALRQRRPSARLILAGPTPDAAYLQAVKQRVADLELETSVQWLGHVANDALIAEIQQASVLALFSREETLPTIIAQAMAAGRPVVASDVGGVREMIADGRSGYLVAADDETALAQRLETVLSDTDKAAAMGREGRALALARYSEAAVADATVRAYRLALSR